jgi:hypothetical protein
LYGRPSWKEFVCIFIHDWGYWGKPNLDGDEGICHPRLGAQLADRWFGLYYWKLCAGHSRSYVEKVNIFGEYGLTTSKLCWADKLSFCYEPKWFYWLRATLSGELKEARELSGENRVIGTDKTYSEWHAAMVEYFHEAVAKGVEQNVINNIYSHYMFMKLFRPIRRMLNQKNIKMAESLFKYSQK